MLGGQAGLPAARHHRRVDIDARGPRSPISRHSSRNSPAAASHVEHGPRLGEEIEIGALSVTDLLARSRGGGPRTGRTPTPAARPSPGAPRAGRQRHRRRAAATLDLGAEVLDAGREGAEPLGDLALLPEPLAMLDRQPLLEVERQILVAAREGRQPVADRAGRRR